MIASRVLLESICDASMITVFTSALQEYVFLASFSSVLDNF